ncbi:MAG: MarR family transcriptional regulator [Bacteroidia bacterium]|nr:MarR family transcriptional regulator [Bacteroidia bacterium]
MKVKEENITRLIDVMFDFIMKMKRDTAACCELMGGLNEKELFVISFIGKNKDVKMTEIASNMNVPLSTLTSIVDKLVEKKYLLRYHSDEDRRVVKVKLATIGSKQYLNFVDQKRDISKKILSEFDSEGQEVLIDNLQKVVNTLSQN